MPYFPETFPNVPYQCEGCGGWFTRPEVGISCAVLHAPGTCCHHGETPADPLPAHDAPRVERMQEIQARAERATEGPWQVTEGVYEPKGDGEQPPIVGMAAESAPLSASLTPPERYDLIAETEEEFGWIFEGDNPPKWAVFLQMYIGALKESRRQLDALKAEKERLQDWKDSAMARLSAWHALGDALSRFAVMRLGEDIAEQLTQQIPAKLEETRT